MRDLYACFQYTYRAAHVVIIPGYVSLSVCVYVCDVVLLLLLWSDVVVVVE